MSDDAMALAAEVLLAKCDELEAQLNAATADHEATTDRLRAARSREDALTARLAEVEGELEKSEAEHLMQNRQHIIDVDKLHAAEAKLAKAEEVVEAVERADLDSIIAGLAETGETTSALQLGRIRRTSTTYRQSQIGKD